MAAILHRLASACRPPDAVCRVPVRAGAGLLACHSYCGSGRAADWGRAAYGPSGAPPPVPRPSWGGGSPLAWQGGCGAAVPLAGLRPSMGLGGGGEGRGGEGGGAPRCRPPVPWCCSPVAAGGGPDDLGPRRSAIVGGGCTPLLLPFHPTGVRLSCGPSPTGPPVLSSPSPRRSAPARGGRGRGGRWGWWSGSAVSG